MEAVIMVVSLVVGLGSLACWIMTIVKAFQSEQSPLLGILCIVLCGLGAFIIGWIKNKEWGHTNIMIAWSVLILLSILIQVAAFALFGANLQPGPAPFGG